LVSAGQRLRTEAGEYTHAELIGCRLIGIRDEGDAEGAAEPAGIGIVRGVEDYGSAPLLTVETVDGREVLVPFARSICKEVDVAGKIIRVDLPEGLLEL
jgi:16S rRNA processing protein RimM